MSGPPDAAKYEALIDQLSVIERRTAAGEIDALDASYDALLAVIGFLHADARVPEREATRPLLRLMSAILDRLRGARPKLLFDRRDTVTKGGAPSYTSAVILRSIVNGAFFALLEGGMSKDEAGKWLASELARNSIKQPNGKAITASAIIRWGAEFRGKSLKGSDEGFAWIVHGALRTMLERGGLTQLPPLEPVDRQGALLAAQMFIRMLRLCGF